MTPAKFSGLFDPLSPCQNLQYRDHATSPYFVRIGPTPSPPVITDVICDWPLSSETLLYSYMA